MINFRKLNRGFWYGHSGSLFRDFPPDIIIRPGVADYNILDFHRGDEIIEVGKHAAIEAIPKLKRLLENQ